ncbi:hypothetical protein X942_5907 [Burkholderia pseudomallei MSHR5596]|nr:hypothetical protein X942_5907 [Burkholderia pseudomallei MSHR5596]
MSIRHDAAASRRLRCVPMQQIYCALINLPAHPLSARRHVQYG